MKEILKKFQYINLLRFSINKNGIFGIHRIIFEDYMNFLVETFIDGILFEDLYRKYLIYVDNRPYIAFSSKEFESNLGKMSLITEVYYDESNFRFEKYVVYKNNLFIKN